MAAADKCTEHDSREEKNTRLLFPDHFHRLLSVQIIHGEQTQEPNCSCATCAFSNCTETDRLWVDSGLLLELHLHSK